MKFFRRLNLRKTWPYLLAMILWELFCFGIFIAICYGVEHYQELPALMETVEWYGYTFTYRDILAIFIWFLVLQVFIYFPVFIWKFFFTLVVKNLKKDE